MGDPDAERQPEMIEPARDAVRAIVAHLADLVRRAQADGSVRSDVDPEAAGWLLLSVLSSRRLRDAAMPADLEPVVTWLALQGISGLWQLLAPVGYPPG